MINSSLATLNNLAFTRLDTEFTDPGGFVNGNCIGFCNENGVQSVWVQFDAGVFQAQMKIANGTHTTYTRCKHESQNWDSINWTPLN